MTFPNDAASCFMQTSRQAGSPKLATMYAANFSAPAAAPAMEQRLDHLQAPSVSVVSCLQRNSLRLRIDCRVRKEPKGVRATRPERKSRPARFEMTASKAERREKRIPHRRRVDLWLDSAWALERLCQGRGSG